MAETALVKAHVPLITSRDILAFAALYSGAAKHLFLHIPKNAGVSLRKAPALRWKMIGVHKQFLKDRAYLDGLLEKMGAERQHHGIAHARLCDVRSSVVRRLQPVAIVRNPWARTVSRYRFALLAQEQGTPFKIGKIDSFEDFLETRHEDGDKPYFWHRAIRGWYPQVDYVLDHQGRIAADILRQEFLDKDTVEYFKIASPPRKRNVTSAMKKVDWKSFYDSKMIQIVADWYAADIEAFGFDFDTAATKNAWGLAA